MGCSLRENPPRAFRYGLTALRRTGPAPHSHAPPRAPRGPPAWRTVRAPGRRPPQPSPPFAGSGGGARLTPAMGRAHSCRSPPFGTCACSLWGTLKQGMHNYHVFIFANIFGVAHVWSPDAFCRSNENLPKWQEFVFLLELLKARGLLLFKGGSFVFPLVTCMPVCMMRCVYCMLCVVCCDVCVHVSLASLCVHVGVRKPA